MTWQRRVWKLHSRDLYADGGGLEEEVRPCASTRSDDLLGGPIWSLEWADLWRGPVRAHLRLQLFGELDDLAGHSAAVVVSLGFVEELLGLLGASGDYKTNPHGGRVSRPNAASTVGV